MISLFEKNLKRMQSELTDLKTANKRGLGTVRFYTEYAEVTVAQGVQKNIKATFDSEGYFPGFAEVIGGPFYGIMTVDENNLTYQASYTSGLPNPQTFTLQVVSTTPIKSLEIT